MTELPILRDLGVIVLAATGFLLLAARLRAPSIVAYIVAGLLLGPVSGLLGATEAVGLIAETGILLLLFLVGLELSIEKIRDIGRVAVVAATAQVFLTAFGAAGISLLLGFETGESAFIGVALAFSSTVVVVKILSQKRDTEELYGRIAVGVLLVQDLLVIIALTLLTGLGEQGDISPGELLASIGTAFAGMLVLLALALLSARYLLPGAFDWMAPSADGVLIASLAWCFLFVAGAELFHLSVEIGAFLAGVSLAQLPHNRDLRRRVRPLMNFFIMVFFVVLGVQMEVGAAVEHLGAAVALSAFVFFGKPLMFLWVIPRMGYAPRTAFLTGTSLSQISEFSFILAALALSNGLIDESVLSMIGVMGLLTIAASAYVTFYNRRIASSFEGRGLLRAFGGVSRGGASEEGRGGAASAGAAGGENAERIRDHVVVVGMNALGRRIVHHLAARGKPLVAIDTDPSKLEELPGRTIVGNVDHLSVLEEAGYREAKLLVSALRIEDTNVLLAHRGHAVGVPTSVHAFDQWIEDDLREAGATHLIRSKDAGVQQTLDILFELDLLQA